MAPSDCAFDLGADVIADVLSRVSREGLAVAVLLGLGRGRRAVRGRGWYARVATAVFLGLTANAAALVSCGVRFCRSCSDLAIQHAVAATLGLFR